eukprot:jgi/Psemu1/326380/estExt_fgenesh1_pg.C_3730004
MNQEIAEALARAKWNESVLVRVAEPVPEPDDDDDDDDDANQQREEDSSQLQQLSRSLLLVPTLDRDQGGIRWENALAETETDESQPQSQPQSQSQSQSEANALKVAMEHHIRTKIWMFPMLNDERRNTLRTQTQTRLGTLDIGSGTGLLALLSSRHLQAARRAFYSNHDGSNSNSNSNSDSNDASATKQRQPRPQTQNMPGIAITSLEMAEPMANIAKRTVALERERERERPHNDQSHLHPHSNADDKAGADGPATANATANASPAPLPDVDVDVDVTVLEGHSGQHPPLKTTTTAATATATTPQCGRTRTKTKTSKSKSESKPLPAPVVLCTSELLESGLLGEGWLPAMRDAWDRHLHPDAVVLPQSARVYARLVSGVAGFAGPIVSLVTEMEMGTEGEHKPENGVCGSGSGSGGRTATLLRLATTAVGGGTAGTLSDGSYDPITGNKQGIQVEIRADRYLATTEKENDNSGGGGAAASASASASTNVPVVQTLSDPIEALDWDVTHPDLIPSPDPTTRSPRNLRVVATETGIAEGVLFWWELDLYKDPHRRRRAPSKSSSGGNEDNNIERQQQQQQQQPTASSKNDNSPIDLTYTTEPGSEFQDHWHQCLYVLSRGDDSGPSSSIAVEKGKAYTLRASHTDSRVHFSLSVDHDDHSNDINENSKTSDPDNSNKRSKPTIPPESNPVVTPRRCWQLNDAERLGKFRDGIRVALNNLAARRATSTSTSNAPQTPLLPATVLDVSDFSLCGMMASLLGATSVTSVESSSSGLALATAKVAQIGNQLPRNNQQTFQILQCHAESLTPAIFNSANDNDNNNDKTDSESSSAAAAVVDMVVGEPYYETLEGWTIETALNFFYTIRMLKRNTIVKPDALCVPARAVVLACGIQCEDLGRSYKKHLSAGNSRVNGFGHQPIVDCWKYDRHGISIPLWEYKGVIPVTEVVRIGTLDYETNAIHRSNQWMEDHPGIRAPFVKSIGWCHAIAFWVDYQIRSDSGSDKDKDQPSNWDSTSSFETVSTGFFSSSQCAERQTVRILSPPQPVKTGESLPIPLHDLEL